MIITDDFVFIHFPKTGGTFVKTILMKLKEKHIGGSKLKKDVLYKFGLKRARYKDLRSPRPNVRRSQHNTCREIPVKFRSLDIVSIIRNPFDYYVSEYEYGSWRRRFNEWGFNLEEVKKSFSNFPDLSFEEYLRLSEEFIMKNEPSLGFYSFRYIHFFSKSTKDILQSLKNNDLDEEKIEKNLFSIEFLKQENLNHDLYLLLLGYGYNKNDIEFITEHERVFPGRRGRKTKEKQRWQNYYTAKLIDWVLHKDRFLFKLYPEYLS